MDFEPIGGWPRKRSAPSPSNFDGCGCLIVLALLFLGLVCCGVVL